MEEKDWILLGAYAKDLKEKLLTFQSLTSNFCCKSSKAGFKARKLYKDFEKLRSELNNLSYRDIPVSDDSLDNLDIFYGCDEIINPYMKEQKRILKKTNWDYDKIKEYLYKEN